MYQCMELLVNVNHMQVVYFKILFYSEMYIYPGTVKFVEKKCIDLMHLYFRFYFQQTDWYTFVCQCDVCKLFNQAHPIHVHVFYFIGNLIEF